MKKSTFGFYLWFYPALALVLAMLGQTLLCALLLGFVLLVEKEEWAARQTLQALLLSLFGSIVGLAVELAGVISYLPLVGHALRVSLDLLDTFAGLLVVIFGVVGICNVCKGKEAGIPLFAALADKVYGRVKEKPVYAQPPYQAYQQSQQPPYQGYPGYQPPQPPPYQPPQNAASAPGVQQNPYQAAPPAPGAQPPAESQNPQPPQA